MKKTFLLFFISIVSLYGFAQNDSTHPSPPSSDGKIFTFTEQTAKFPGGNEALMRFLQQNINYPEVEAEKNIQGKVLLRFIVTESGDIEDIVVLRGVSPSLDQEAIRVVKSFPKFSPGLNQGKPVKVYFHLPVVFKL